MADRTFTFSIPQDLARRADRGAPIVIRNAKLAVVKRTTLDASIDLPPGWYAAQSVLPDGQELEAVFELQATGNVDPVELNTIDVSEDADPFPAPGFTDLSDEDGPGLAIEAAPGDFGDPAGGGFGEDAAVAAGPDFDFDVFGAAASPNWFDFKSGLGTRRLGPAFSTGFAKADTLRPSEAGTRWQLVRFDWDSDESTLLEEGAEESSLKIEALPADERKNRCLRIERPGIADVNFSLPVSFSEGATYSFAGPVEDWGFELEDPDADLLFGYLGGRRVSQLAQLVERQGPTWQRLFNADDLRPVAGVVGAYALLLVGDTGGERAHANIDWSTHIHLAEQLARSPQAPSDAQAIFGEFLARLGRHDEAVQEFGSFLSRGLPICSIGLRIVVDRLLGYRNLVDKKGLSTQGIDLDLAIRTVGKLADYVDFDQPGLSFTTTPGGHLGNDAHGGAVARNPFRSVRQASDQRPRRARAR